jgi:hypothetical protein
VRLKRTVTTDSAPLVVVEKTLLTSSFSLWQRWLFLVGLIMSAFGVLLALFNATPLFALFDQQINPVFWGTVDIPGEARDFQKWVYGVLGATLAGWGVFLAFIAHYPFKRREKWAETACHGVLVWFRLTRLSP